MFYWALAVTALGWFLVGKGISVCAGVNSVGKVTLPTRYRTRRGANFEITWKKTETQPPKLTTLILLISLFTAPLVARPFVWSWLMVITLILLSIFIWIVADLLHAGVKYFIETNRRQGVEDEVVIDYQLETVPLTQREQLLLVNVAVCWVGIGWMLKKTGLGEWLVIAGLLAGLALMALLMYLLEKREQAFKWQYSFDYCKRCGSKLKSITQPEVTREHRGGDYYIERTEFAVYKRCRVCGAEERL